MNDKTNQPNRDVKQQPGGFRPIEVLTSEHDAVLAPDHEYSDCFVPSFWSIIAPLVGRDDIIRVRTEDQRFYAELYVVDANRQGLSVVEMRHISLQKEVPELAPDADYEVKWKGPQWRYCVVRKSDNAMMQKHLTDKVDAYNWIQLKLAA